MAHNLSNIILKQQIQGTMASSRSNTLVNFSVGKNFSPSITGGTSSPDADVIYAFKATASGSSGASSTSRMVLDLQASTSALSGGADPTVTNRDSSGGAQLDAEGNAAASLHATNGSIISIFMYTNPNEHRGDITVSDSVLGSDTGLFTIPVFTFTPGGSTVNSLLVTPHVAPNDLRLDILFAQGADELNVVVLGESA